MHTKAKGTGSPLVESLIDRVIEGQKPSHVLQHSVYTLAGNFPLSHQTINVGENFSCSMGLRTFFDGEGLLRFCNENDVLIKPVSDPRLLELMVYADNLDVDNPLFDLFEKYEGTLEDLYQKVTSVAKLAPQLGV